MPELPEVETTRRGIEPYALGQTVEQVIVRNPKLRWPVPEDLNQRMAGQSITRLDRRGKYLLLFNSLGCCILHLGMSGSLRVVNNANTVQKHDHVDICFTTGYCIRLRDPRRFGAVLWCEHDPLEHKLLSQLGPEPLSDNFTGDYLFKVSRNRKRAVKLMLMDSHIVVGVGNIYANEALYLAGITPTAVAGRISRARYMKLATAVKTVLSDAIEQGGTTLKDFTTSDGSPGYFAQKLNVYGKADNPCPRCGNKITLIKLGQRASYYCRKCQR